jgi:hypothetical protein
LELSLIKGSGFKIEVGGNFFQLALFGY